MGLAAADRRSWGVVLLTVVLLCAVVIPVWGGRRVSGLAQLAAPPLAPQVGECLAQLPSERSALDFLPPVLSGVTGSCGEQNVGEIVSLANDVDDFPRTMVNTLSRPEPLACDPMMLAYIRWPASGVDGENGALASDGVRWRPWSTLSVGLLGPNLQQYFAGQRWVACVVYPEFAPFSGSLAGSVRDGQAADAFATCLVDADTDAVGSCSQPHQAELFGWVRADAATGDLTAACVDLVDRLTGMADPTAGGQLVVALHGFEGRAPVTSVVGPASLKDRLSCSVSTAGQRRLTSTLIGIGDKSLPWQ